MAIFLSAEVPFSGQEGPEGHDLASHSDLEVDLPAHVHGHGTSPLFADACSGLVGFGASPGGRNGPEAAHG